MNAKVTAIARVLALIIVLINQWLSNIGVSPIPVDESTLMTIAVALVTMWKDNPVTDAAHDIALGVEACYFSNRSRKLKSLDHTCRIMTELCNS
ncbi:hypothetical protein CD110_11785 [Staphylococcus casei]|uniref:phage holin n=1 Tax=Staphylococcus TaxID=1279 RepID=UPI000CD0A40B|nr:phage holin [Staphylococcus casei]PNZ57389.1 hypothetical protein CD110_11785 [Staphylococcus casei]WJE85530.1 phage holin [Staphylococcus casei]